MTALGGSELHFAGVAVCLLLAVLLSLVAGSR